MTAGAILNLPLSRVRTPKRRRPPRAVVSPLATARFGVDSPWPKVRYSGSRARGKAYERSLVKPLRCWSNARKASLEVGPWIRFEDINGLGFAQPDFLIFDDDLLWILEAKLTDCPEARDQLLGLYAPLCHHLWPKLVQIPVVVTKNLVSGSKGRPIHKLEEVFGLPQQEVYLWHFFG